VFLNERYDVRQSQGNKDQYEIGKIERGIEKKMWKRVTKQEGINFFKYYRPFNLYVFLFRYILYFIL